jgi:nucleotide-binding universal stress UspA family protein
MPIGRILAPFDGSEISVWMLRRARELLRAAQEVRLLAVVAAPPDRAADPAFRADPRHRDAARAVERARDGLLEAGLSAEARLRFGDPVQEILREAARADLVAMATHGRVGVERLLFGSVALRVVQRCPAPLALFRPLQRPDESLSPVESREPARFRSLLVPLDRSPASEEILPVAERLAQALDARVTLLTVVAGARDRAAAEEGLDGLAGALRARGTDASAMVRVSPPRRAARRILEVVEARAFDAVAMTTHGRTLARTLFGSVAEAVLARLRVPVVTIRNRALRGGADLPADAGAILV